MFFCYFPLFPHQYAPTIQAQKFVYLKSSIELQCASKVSIRSPSKALLVILFFYDIKPLCLWYFNQPNYKFIYYSNLKFTRVDVDIHYCFYKFG
jgi:hypothetical protein